MTTALGGDNLGKWVALLPTKLGGGTYALDLNTNRVLASIWYWTYGDYNPISHHLCAFRAPILIPALNSSTAPKGERAASRSSKPRPTR